MSFPGVVWGSEGDQFEHTSDKKRPFGTVLKLVDGREFVYAQAGGTALNTGKLMQQAVVTSGHTKDLNPASTAAIGATAVTITNSTTAITANMYAEGYLFTNDAAGEGYLYKIKSHPAESTGSGSCEITLEEGSALRVALTTSSEVGLRKHPCDEVVVAPTTFTGIVVGMAVREVTANYYCWLQTKGPACVLTYGTVIVGKAVTRSATTAGAVDVYPLNSVDASGQQPMLGNVLSVASSAEYSLVDLNVWGN